MRMTYSPEADALDIELAAGGKQIETRELAPDVFADYDRGGRLLAIEILGASRFYERQALEQLATAAEYLTLADAARESKLSPSTLRVQINAGRLAAEKRGRDWVVARHELWNYLENRAPQGRPGAVPRGRHASARRQKAAQG